VASVLTGLHPASWSAEEAVRYDTAREGAAQVIGFCAAADARGRGSWHRLQATWAVRRRELTPYAVNEVAAIHSDGEDLLAETLPPEQAEHAFDSNRIFQERILPNELTGTSQRRPVVVIVAGQPGDGTVTALARDLLTHRGQPVVISPDRHEPYHPDFWKPIGDEEPGPPPGCRAWTADAVKYAQAQRFDVILESSHGLSARDFQAAGYRVEVAIVAAAPAVQLFGAIDRHVRALEAYGCGRLVDPVADDPIDLEQYADLVAVVRPNGELLYGNQRTADGRGPRDPAAAEAINAELDRRWSIPESRRFLEAVTAYERRGLSAPVLWVREKTAEGAKAVTALAQPHLHPDVVTFHKAIADVR
jgi:UDP-N-acetylglucosamine kinase